jgi:hypothetical protein
MNEHQTTKQDQRGVRHAFAKTIKPHPCWDSSLNESMANLFHLTFVQRRVHNVEHVTAAMAGQHTKTADTHVKHWPRARGNGQRQLHGQMANNVL